MNELLQTNSREFQEEPVSDAVNPVPSDPSKGTKTVVLAEDEPVVREFMAAVLREMCYIVLEAENGEQALSIFERSRGQRIDLLLTDIVMPVMGGKVLAYKVESLYPETKIVFCSAYPEKLGISNGMFDNRIPFLQKPVIINALKLKVREVLGDATEDLPQSSEDIGTPSASPAASPSSHKAECVLNRTEEVLNRDVFIEDAEPKVLAAPRLDYSLLPAATNNGTAGPSTPVTEPQAVTPRQERRTRMCWRRLLLTALVFVGSLYGLITLGRTAFDNFIHEQEAHAAASRTQQVLATLQSLASSLHAAESGARGFAISGQQMHLDQYYGAVNMIRAQLGELQGILRDDSAALKQFRSLEALITAHLAVLKEMVELGNKNVFRAVGQKALTDQGYETMQKISATLQAMEQSARARLAGQSDVALQQAHIARVALLEGGALACAVLLLCSISTYWLLIGNGKVKDKLNGFLESSPDAIVIVNKEGKIVVSNSYTERLLGYAPQELAGQTVAILVPERYRKVCLQQYGVYFANRGEPMTTTSLELSAVHKDGHEFPIDICMKPLETEQGILVTSALRDISQRKQTEQKVTRLNEQLEQRAAELEAANKELEAFSYSVSHDLRSPLHNIDGFSQVLLEDYADRLDAEGQEHLKNVRSSCRQMEEIIDALLALSKMMRTEMFRQKVDLSVLACQIADELKAKAPDRAVDFVIANDLTADADAQLLRVVLENLLNNAWKFTSKKPRARIEVGSLLQSNGDQVFYVRDDGAGFDMEHAQKLFSPFKRLHKASDFQGTGIGLATVQRIIARHGGKIWASAAIDHGATFCFTLAAANKDGVS
jgi:PAS domain S-box-containing protein